MSTIKIYCDGGARGNPGPAASAFVVYDNEDKLIDKGSKFLGKATNNEAEYEAVILSLEWLKQNAHKLQIQNLEYYLDSELVVKQLKGVYKIKSEKLAKKVIKIKELEKKLGISPTFTHVKRNQNPVSDKLVNQALDKNS